MFNRPSCFQGGPLSKREEKPMIITNITLPSRKQSYMMWMCKQAKVERVQRTNMPFRMRLAAIQATSNKHAINKTWSKQHVYSSN